MRFARHHCASCELSIYGTKEDPVWHSGLYGSHHTLCKSCMRHEDDTIEEKGTNYIPELLKHYNTPNKSGNWNPYEEESE